VGYDSNGNTTNSAGIHPKAALTGASNRLYGVMSGGGTGGSGTVFAVNPDGSGFTNLHSFSPTPIGWYTNYDGATPKARLELSGNTLYGAASSGGPKGMGSGTLFKLNTDGSGFATLFNFPDDSNGGTGPNGLVLAGGMLYGTTAYGGQAYGGTVFKIAPNGSGFTRMHEFSASAYNPSIGSMTNSDGAYPQAALVVSGTTLYGTASGCGSNGCGTVFKINTDGSGFAVLHHFTASEGSSPSGELFLSGDLMYGTAESGGSAYAGTVFQIGMDGTRFSRLLAFPSTVYNGAGNYTNSSGAAPYGALLLSGGMLYGTTESGGSAGSGTIFAVNTNGSGFTNLYTFSGFDLSTRTNLDGANPYAGLALSDSTVYATTYNGGDAGYGSLFALNLLAAPPQVQIQCNGTAMVFTWPSSAMGFVLQKNPGLIPANWAPIGLSVTDDGTTRSVTIAAPLGNLFFRLAKP